MEGEGSEEARGSISKGSVLTMLKYVSAALDSYKCQRIFYNVELHGLTPFDICMIYRKYVSMIIIINFSKIFQIIQKEMAIHIPTYMQYFL